MTSSKPSLTHRNGEPGENFLEGVQHMRTASPDSHGPCYSRVLMPFHRTQIIIRIILITLSHVQPRTERKHGTSGYEHTSRPRVSVTSRNGLPVPFFRQPGPSGSYRIFKLMSVVLQSRHSPHTFKFTPHENSY